MVNCKIYIAKIAIKSTIFELQKSYLHIFGVAQNFRINGGAQKLPELSFGARRLVAGSQHFVTVCSPSTSTTEFNTNALCRSFKILHVPHANTIVRWTSGIAYKFTKLNKLKKLGYPQNTLKR